MKLFCSIVVLISFCVLTKDSVQNKETKSIEVTKSLKIINIHDTVGPVIRLV